MRNFKLDNLFVLVDKDNLGNIYPKIFMSKKDAQKCIDIIGGNYNIKQAFINETI